MPVVNVHPLQMDLEFLIWMKLQHLKKTRNIITQRGLKQVSQIMSSEKGVLVTTRCITSPQGSAIPPGVEFLRVHFKSHVAREAPPGSLGLAHPFGCMAGEDIAKVMDHFIKHISSLHPKTILLC